MTYVTYIISHPRYHTATIPSYPSYPKYHSPDIPHILSISVTQFFPGFSVCVYSLFFLRTFSVSLSYPSVFPTTFSSPSLSYLMFVCMYVFLTASLPFSRIPLLLSSFLFPPFVSLSFFFLSHSRIIFLHFFFLLSPLYIFFHSFSSPISPFSFTH